MGEALWCVAVGQAPQVVAVGYACSSPGLAQVARLAKRLPWYLHPQLMYLPSLPGQSSEVLCHHPHPHPYSHPLPPLPPHLPTVHLLPLYCHRPFP